MHNFLFNLFKITKIYFSSQLWTLKQNKVDNKYIGRLFKKNRKNILIPLRACYKWNFRIKKWVKFKSKTKIIFLQINFIKNIELIGTLRWNKNINYEINKKMSYFYFRLARRNIIRGYFSDFLIFCNFMCHSKL